jgi:outer membrane protein assembly factor BamB
MARRLFHVKPSRFPPLALAAIVLPLLVGCAAIASPEGWAAPVADGDLVVVHTDSGRLTAFRLGDGGVTPAWEYPLADEDTELDAVYATPVIHNGRLYAAGYSGSLVALDLSSGRPVEGWTPPQLDDRIVATPVVDEVNGQLIVVTEGGDVRTVDLGSGVASVARSQLDGRIWGTPALVGETLYVGSIDRRLAAISTVDGAILWQDEESSIPGDLRADGGLLLAGALDQRLRAFELASPGVERWSFPSDTWFWARPAVENGVVYAADANGIVFAIDAESGAERWRSGESHGEIRAEPVLAGNSVLLGTRDGVLFALDRETGVELWPPVEPDVGRLLASPLVLDSGDVLFVTDSGTLLRVQPARGDVSVLFERS